MENEAADSMLGSRLIGLEVKATWSRDTRSSAACEPQAVRAAEAINCKST